MHNLQMFLTTELHANTLHYPNLFLQQHCQSITILTVVHFVFAFSSQLIQSKGCRSAFIPGSAQNSFSMYVCICICVCVRASIFVKVCIYMRVHSYQFNTLCLSMEWSCIGIDVIHKTTSKYFWMNQLKKERTDWYIDRYWIE